MLSADRKILQNLVKGHSNVLLYGGKSTGKTTLVKSIFQSAKKQYIYINCILTDDRASFLKLFNFEFRKYLKKIDEVFIDVDDEIFTKKFNSPVNLEGWIQQMKKLFDKYKQLKELKRLYIFLDKIQELNVSETFLSNFYKVCTKQLKFIKFSFFLAGITNKNNIYTLEDPFRSIISFCLDKPYIKPIVEQTINESLKVKFPSKSPEDKDLKKLRDYLILMIFHKFETLECDLEKIRKIIKIVVNNAHEFMTCELKKVNFWINSEHSKDFLNQVAEYGPLSEQDIKTKIQTERNKEEGQTNFYEYYPNLLLSAIHLAEANGQNDDKRRFFDYKRSTKRIQRGKSKKKEKVTRNTVQRLVAIAQVLESQTKGRKEKLLEHHSLDFYGCIQYLISEGKLNYASHTIKSYGGKVTGKAKQDEVKYFMRQLDLDYNQFMG